MHWWHLAAAILFETIATTALKASQGFSQFWPSALCTVGYVASFYLLAQALRVIPVGVAYAIWSGMGLVLICLAAYFLFGEKLDLPAILGILMIIGGVTLLNVASSTASH